MRFRFVQMLLLLGVLAGAYAGTARALDFDDEDPTPPRAEIGLVYHYEIGTHAGCLPHHLVLGPGALPPGLALSQLNDHTGLVSGMATQPGTYTVWIYLIDCAGTSAQTLFTFDVWPRRYSITTTSVNAASVGSPYSFSFETSGIPSNTIWSVSAGTLPAGLSLSKEGTISGTPTTTGKSTFTITATGFAKDFSGTRIDAHDFTLNVASLAATVSRPTGEVGVRFTSSLVGSGGQAPYTWSAASGLPPGLSVAGDGALSGVPSSAGAFTVTAHVVDSAGAAKDVQARLVIRPRLAIAAKGLPAAVAGKAYRAKVTVRGGASGVRWSLTKGALPAGLKLGSTTGTISGVPRSSGTFRVSVRVRDSLGAVSTKTLVLLVR
jgi:hypothetical protein